MEIGENKLYFFDHFPTEEKQSRHTPGHLQENGATQTHATTHRSCNGQHIKPVQQEKLHMLQVHPNRPDLH